MKSVGRLSEFIHFPGSGQSGQSPACYVYRRISEQGKSQQTELTGLLLGATSTHDQTPLCLVYRAGTDIDVMIRQLVGSEPDYVLKSEGSTTRHQFWLISDAAMQSGLEHRLEQITGFYPLHNWVLPDTGSDSENSRAGGSCSTTADLTYTLLLTDQQLKPQACHRLLADLAGMDDYEFLQRLQKCFNIRVASGAIDATPKSAREFGLYVAGYWYHLRLIDGTWFHADPVSDLDVSVVHDNMIAPMLGITSRQDPRLACTDADCNVHTLQQLVDSGRWQAAWLMPAPTVEQMMHISDLGRVMPPNSVCFTPIVDTAVLAGIAR